METLIAVVIIVLILIIATSKIVKEKKSGVKCIGCLHSKKSKCR